MGDRSHYHETPPLAVLSGHRFPHFSKDLTPFQGDGHIEIALSRSASRVEIRITDDGPGILPEQRRHLFDPFYSARQAGRGLGFGLSKAWRIVTNHGGTIEVESQPGNGATFTITLPCRVLP